MRTASSRRQKGWTLLELLVVMPLLALLLSTSAMLLTIVFRSQGRLSEDIQQRTSLARLAIQWRMDAHGSRTARCDSPQSCDFTREDGDAVHYEIKETKLHREVRKGDAVTSRETYPLAGLAGDFSLDRSQELLLVRLRLQAVAEPRKYAPTSRASLLEAAVGSLLERSSKGGSP